jgi:photosystem II stability/assembly factor-like uncharacterized protein
MVITCRRARLLLQCSDDLPPLDARLLDRHVQSCPRCAEIAKQRVDVDALLRRYVTRQPAPSVAGAVRARLEAGDRVGVRPLKPHRRILPRAWLSAPLVAAALLTALVAPQTLPDGARPVPVVAAWHLVRPQIGYPLAVDPVQPGHLLAGAWGRIYESRNRGASWRALAPLPPHLIIRSIAIDRSDLARYLVATNNSIFVSDDAGAHWRERANSLPGHFNMFVLQDSVRPNRFYAGPSVLWKSDDHGETWSRDGSGEVFAPDGIQALDSSPDGTLLTGIWGGGVALSHDGGVTWRRSTQGLSRDVMDVERGRAAWWAASDRGIYRSIDGGKSWRRDSPPHFFATSVLPRSGYVIAAGDHAVYRSRTLGGRWILAMRGLPFNPYVNSLLADPFRPNTVYASLNSDGIFRSDDAGRTWRAMNDGLPLHGDLQPVRHILFRRSGALWITNVWGSDPQVLTVDRDVRLFSLSPDEASAAYVAGTAGEWEVRLVGAGGSMARNLVTGSGPVPRALMWSPSAALLAVVGASEVTLTNLAQSHTWKLSSADHVIGWTASGRSLLVWNAMRGRLEERSPLNGALRTVYSGLPAEPKLAPDGRHVAFVNAGRLYVGALPDAATSLLRVTPGCEASAFSATASRVLLRCGSGLEIVDARTRTISETSLPAGARWAPGSDSTILFNRSGDLWAWTHSHGTHLLVRNAHEL